MKSNFFNRTPDGDDAGAGGGSNAPKTDNSKLVAGDTVYVSPDGGTTDEAFPKQGVEYDFCTDVTNTGKLASGDFYVRFTLSGDQDPPWVQDFKQDAGLDAGSSVKAVVHFGSFPNEFKSYYLEACIYSPSAPEVPIHCAGTFEFAVTTESSNSSSSDSTGSSDNSSSSDSGSSDNSSSSDSGSSDNSSSTDSGSSDNSSSSDPGSSDKSSSTDSTDTSSDQGDSNSSQGSLNS